MAKKVAKTVKKEISAKAVGRNVILVIDGQKHSKAFPLKEDRVKVLEEVEAYNKRNSIKRLNGIIKMMLKTTGKKTTKPKAPKKVKTTKVAKDNSDKLKEAKKLLEQDGYTVSKQTARNPTPSRRRGEY